LKKINTIEITNFKSIKHLKIDGCKKINVFVGMPNAGKSNILEALGLFFDLERHRPLNLLDYVRYETIDDFFFEGNISEKIKICIDKNLTLNIEKLDLNKIQTTDFVNYLGNEEHLMSYFTLSENIIDIDMLRAFSSDFNFIGDIKKYTFKEIKNISNSNFSKLEFPFGENIGQIIASNNVLRNEVNKIFNDNNLKLLIEKSTNKLRIFKEYKDGTVFSIPYELIADTLQRLIFYKAAIMSNKNSVLLFEEPEAHCFEPYILEFTNGVKYDENENQFFIVTHSDFIIKEFLRDDESKENTNIYLVNNVDGETQVKLLEKDKNEEVHEYGMNVFFNFESLWETN